MLIGGQGTKRRRNVAENFNRLSRAHEHYRRQTDRQTDRRTDDDISLKTMHHNEMQVINRHCMHTSFRLYQSFDSEELISR